MIRYGEILECRKEMWIGFEYNKESSDGLGGSKGSQKINKCVETFVVDYGIMRQNS